MSRVSPEGGSLRVWRAAGLISTLAGAVGSVGFVFYYGRRNPSRLLIVLFAIWVLSPFVALLAADARSRRWPPQARATLCGVMLVIAAGSLATYANAALGPPKAQGAFAFVIVPPLSWLLSGVAVSIGLFARGRHS
jgi:glucose dehydrogenase